MNFFNSKKDKEIVSVLPDVEAIGSSGTEIYGGYIKDESLAALTGRKGQKTYKQMARRDYNLSMCLSAVKRPIQSSPLEVRVATDDENGEKKRLLCERVLDDMLTSKEKIVEEMLSCVEQGFYIGERTFENVVNNPITDENGKVVFQSYTGLRDISYRSQSTIEKWNTDENGRLKSIKQISYGDLAKSVIIEKNSLVHIAINSLGSNFEGVSMLRPAYGSYVRKDKYLKLNVMGAEKYAIPTVIGTMPQGVSDDVKAKFSMALKALVSGAKNFIRLGKDYEVKSDNIQYDPSKLEVSIDKEDMRQARVFLANFLLLGQTGEGSRAVSNDLGQFFINSLEYIASLIERALNDQLRLVQIANLGEQSNYATVKFVGISDRFGSEMATIINLLTSAGIITPDQKLEASLRKRIGVPEIDEETRREKEPVIEQLPFSDNKENLTLSERVVKRWHEKQGAVND